MILLFNVYISDLPQTVFKQYGYADDLGALIADKNWNIGELTFTEDLDKVASYVKRWQLKSNRKQITKLIINLEGTPCPTFPTYPDVKLDRQLAFRQRRKGYVQK